MAIYVSDSTRLFFFMKPSIKSKPQKLYEIQTMFPHLMIISLYPETLSELRSLCNFDFIEGVRKFFSVQLLWN